MTKSKPAPDRTDPDNPEWTTADFQKALPASEALPASLLKKLGVRGPQKAPIKVLVSIRLSREVVDTFRASGEGWQTRVDLALKDWLVTHQPI
jgi:uncharacterized protein (DUF4415 family)